MRSSSRCAAALAALTLVAPGCVTGHLLDAARRRERPVEIEAASLDGERLVLAYAAQASDDRGHPLFRAERRAAVPLGQLRDGSRPTDAYTIAWLPAEGPLPGRALPVVRPGELPPAPTFVAIAAAGEAGAPVVHLRGADDVAAAGFPAAALTRRTTAPWSYALLPLTVAFDAATLPPLAVLGLPLLAFGD